MGVLAVLADLYDFETKVENGFRDCLNKAFVSEGKDPKIFISQDVHVQGTPRIEIQLQVSGELEQRTGEGQQGRPTEVTDSREGTLIIAVCTTRSPSADRAFHGFARGLIRAVMSGHNGSLADLAPAMEKYQLLGVAETGASPTVEVKGEDVTELSFGIIWAIRPEAWPISP